MAQAPVPTQDNAQWIKTNLIDKDPTQSAAVEQLAGQWVNHGMPRDGKLRDATTAIVNQAVTAHAQAWPADAQSFTQQEISRAVDLVIDDIAEQAQFLQTEQSLNMEQQPQSAAQEVPSQRPAAETQPDASQPQTAGEHATEPVAQANPKKERWPRVNFPNGFVHPFQRTGKDGRIWEMMRVSIPNGVTLNGIDIGGWQMDRFMDRYAKEDKLNGRPVTVSFKPNTPIELWRGAGETRQTMSIENPWELCKAVKTQREAYAAAKAAEREQHQPQQRMSELRERSHEESVPEPETDGDRDHPEPAQTPTGISAIPDHSDFNDGVPRTFGGYRFEPLTGDPVTMHDPYAVKRGESKMGVLDGIKQRAEQRTAVQPAASVPTQVRGKTR
ncbi:hypothetical protein [Bifidobacterium aerophilum]|uniref:Uncharacterized protein n=1 Tax=Bifidobacterium aerophilum TaxID=1798155 RepID=A0A6N9Z5C8_9BIFI|nr:hypothetical protein [Bifidobacterium aerophilum]NEG89842.1 hypothetical protein [Bifidobacterium aerophilum]